MVTSFIFSSDAWADEPAITLSITWKSGAYHARLSLNGFAGSEWEGVVDGSVVETLVSMVRVWKQSYFRPVLDDTNWVVEWQEDGRVESRQGSNAFPAHWGRFVRLVKRIPTDGAPA